MDSSKDNDPDPTEELSEALEYITELEKLILEQKQRINELESECFQLHAHNTVLQQTATSPNKNTTRKKQQRRMSALTASMGKSNALGNSTESIDQVAIINQNLDIFLHTINAHEQSQNLVQQAIDCIAATVNLEVTLNGTRDAHCSNPFGRGELGAALKRVFNKVLVFLASFLNDEESPQTKFEALPYPLKWLVKSFPDCIANQDQDRGWLPLHWCVALGRPLVDDIRVICESVGEDAFRQPVSPLSIAVAKESLSIEVVSYLLQLFPDSASFQDADGSYPLMHACANNRGTEMADLLFDSYCDAAAAPDNFGCYAIHYAARSGRREMFQWLIDTCPETAHHKSVSGAFPLHDAVQNKVHATVGVLTILYNANKEAVSTQDNNGALPLHLAAQHASLEIVRFIYSSFPKATFVSDHEGRLPVTCAHLRTDNGEEVLRFLQSTNPQSTVEDLVELLNPPLPPPPPLPSTSTSSHGTGGLSTAAANFKAMTGGKIGGFFNAMKSGKMGGR